MIDIDLAQQLALLKTSLKTTLAKLKADVEKTQRFLESIDEYVNGTSTARTITPSPPSAKPREARQRHEPGNHRKAIVGILLEAGKPLHASDIAKHAYESKLIESNSGYRGVYASVFSVLRRNSKHAFIQLPRKVWDLRERRQPHAGPAPSPAPNSAIDRDAINDEKSHAAASAMA